MLRDVIWQAMWRVPLDFVGTLKRWVARASWVIPNTLWRLTKSLALHKASPSTKASIVHAIPILCMLFRVLGVIVANIR